MSGKVPVLCMLFPWAAITASCGRPSPIQVCQSALGASKRSQRLPNLGGGEAGAISGMLVGALRPLGGRKAPASKRDGNLITLCNTHRLGQIRLVYTEKPNRRLVPIINLALSQTESSSSLSYKIAPPCEECACPARVEYTYEPAFFSRLSSASFPLSPRVISTMGTPKQ